MNIGGDDIIFYVPSEVPANEMIANRIRGFWPDARMQLVEEEESHPIDAPEAPVRGVFGGEMLIYRDEAAALSWDRQGMTPENTDSMLLCIVGEPSKVKDGLREVTLVCGERTREMEQLVRDLKADFGGVEAEPDWAGKPIGASLAPPAPTDLPEALRP